MERRETPGEEPGSTAAPDPRAQVTETKQKKGVLPLVPPRDTPHAETLARAAVAFHAGDAHLARILCRQALAAEPAAEERVFCNDLISRLKPDPVAIVMGLACATLLLVVTIGALGAG